jgi:hypothetical protein
MRAQSPARYGTSKDPAALWVKFLPLASSLSPSKEVVRNGKGFAILRPRE